MGEWVELLKGELLKQRRSFIWPIVVLTPFLAGSLSFINLYLRYDYLMGLEVNRELTPWQLLLFQHHFLWIFFLSLVVCILTMQIHYLEYKSNSWKFLLALPLSRTKVYLAKWAVAFSLSLIMLLLNQGILVMTGKLLGFAENTDWHLLSCYTLYQIPAVLSLLSLQSFLCTQLTLSTGALAIGFVGIASSFFFAQSEYLTRLLPYAHLLYTLPHPTLNNAIPLTYGLISGLVFLFLGIWSFQRKDI